MMPTREIVKAFIADVMTEDHVGVIERWYHEDAFMQENQDEPRQVRMALIEGERRMLARVLGVSTALVSGPLINKDNVAIRWHFTFSLLDGRTLTQEEVAWQTWRGERIWRESFFYDPKQMAG